MKHKLSYILVLTLSILSTISFGQISMDEFLQEVERNRPASLDEPTNIQGNNTAASNRDEDDLLLATRADQWNIDWVETDSVEYYYNSEGLEIENITLVLDSAQWKNSERTLSEYNSNGNLSLQLYFDWNGTDWDTTSQLVTEFDVDFYATSFTIQNWDGMDWINFFRVLLEYDNNGNPILLVRQFGDGNDWDNYLQTISEYDQNNNIIVDSSLIWNGNDWNNDSKVIYEYDTGNNLILQQFQNWVGGDWVNSLQFIREFDSDNNETSQLKQVWNGNNWEDNNRITNDYNMDNNITLILEERWNGINWVNVDQDVYDYTFNQIVSITTQVWDEDSIAWLNTYHLVEESDEYENQIYRLDQEWDGTDWMNISQMYFYYEIITSNSNLAGFENQFEIYPNPGNGNFTIEFNNYALREATLHVYNAIGQLQHYQAITNGVKMMNLNLSNLQTGTYFLQIKNGDDQITKAVQILK